jgi:flagellar assembly protein FliH
LSSPGATGGARIAPAPPPRRGLETFDLPNLGLAAEALPPPPEPERGDGFAPLVLMDKPQEDPRISAERQAQEMLSTAQAEAEATRQRAQREGYEEGYQKGYKTGQDEGLVASKARVEAACDNLGRALGVLDQARAALLGMMETEMVALAQAATDRILLAPEAVDPALVRRAVHEAVTRVVEAERLTVRLHPEDLAHVREFRERLLDDLGGLKHLELRPDPVLRRGDCVVDSPTAQVDATLETRRKRIFDLLADAFRQGQRLDMDQVLEEALEQALAHASQAPAAAADTQAVSAASEAPATPATVQAAAPAPAPAAASELEDW